MSAGTGSQTVGALSLRSSLPFLLPVYPPEAGNGGHTREKEMTCDRLSRPITRRFHFILAPHHGPLHSGFALPFGGPWHVMRDRMTNQVIAFFILVSSLGSPCGSLGRLRLMNCLCNPVVRSQLLPLRFLHSFPTVFHSDRVALGLRPHSRLRRE